MLKIIIIMVGPLDLDATQSTHDVTVEVVFIKFCTILYYLLLLMINYIINN